MHQSYSQKPPRGQLNFVRVEEQEEAGALATVSHLMLLSVFSWQSSLMYLSNYHEYEIIVYFPYEMGRNYFLHLKDQNEIYRVDLICWKGLFSASSFKKKRSDLQLEAE